MPGLDDGKGFGQREYLGKRGNDAASIGERIVGRGLIGGVQVASGRAGKKMESVKNLLLFFLDRIIEPYERRRQGCLCFFQYGRRRV